MCGRISYVFSAGTLRDLMGLVVLPSYDLVPRYNVAPTQLAPIVRIGGAGRESVLLRWGLVPSWSNDVAIGSRMINARAETIAEKPAFRKAFAERRCLVPISGFYEWRAAHDGGAKTPFWIGREDRRPFALAGVWERNTRLAEPLETFTILTTTPNTLMAPIHDRMPVILSEAAWGAWLDPRNSDTGTLTRWLAPADPHGFEAYPVGTRVNNPRIDDASLAEPTAETELF